MTLTFAEDTHTYTEDGIEIPSVTQILEMTGIVDVSGIPKARLDYAADRGTAVHLATQYLDEDDLDTDHIDSEILPYIVAYQRFKEEREFTPERIEYRMVGKVNDMKFGMTMDRLGEMTVRGKKKRYVLDLKTSSQPQKSWPIQTAAYKTGYCREDKDLGRGVVHLKKDATFSLLIHDREDDFSIWEAALRLAYWKLRTA